jgi:signal transduction histidine kinase
MKGFGRSLVGAIFPLALAAIAGVSALTVLALPDPSQGLHLTYQDGQVVVASVDYGSIAQVTGLRPGQVIVMLDDQYVLGASDAFKRATAASVGPWQEVFTADRDQMVCDAGGTCTLLPPFQLSTGTVELGQTFSTMAPGLWIAPGQIYASVGGPPGAFHDFYRFPFSRSPEPFAAGLAILIFGWLALSRGWAGSTLKSYAVTLPVATAVPLFAVAVNDYPSGIATVVESILVPLAMLPLVIDFLDRVEGRRLRWLVAAVAVALAVAACVAGLLIPTDPELFAWLVCRNFLVMSVAFVPGLVAARPIRRHEMRSSPALPRWRAAVARVMAVIPGPFGAGLSRRLEASSTTMSGPTPRALVESVDVLVAALTPGIAAFSLGFVHSIEVWPVVLWIGAVIAMRLALRSLAQLATGARHERDLVVAATESERVRIAADIHDDALQDLTMLVRRLDAAGDTANAQAAREIAERLRAICGDLRLPVLDDLGVGPALEWLCGRLDPVAHSITLDRLSEESRLPADVELAVFRVAQEALSNAVRHGAPPILVRYRARPDWVELEVDDSGSGIADGAAELAEQTGHLGLLNMAQRVEAVGGMLRIGPGPGPGGGTRVSLTWARTSGSALASAPAPA